jgi:hypothetical protein
MYSSKISSKHTESAVIFITALFAAIPYQVSDRAARPLMLDALATFRPEIARRGIPA